MDNKLQQKYALITGASSGIGKAFAQLLAGKGYNLVIIARNGDELNRLAGVEMTRNDCTIIPIVLDLSKASSIDELQDELAQRNISPDLIVNSAGFGLAGEVVELDRKQQLAMLDLNIRALSDITLRFLPAMVERNQGGIINIASVAAYAPGPYMAIYYASKAYVHSFSVALAHELKSTRVNVTCVAPGPVETGFQQRSGMQLSKWIFKLPGTRTAEQVANDGWSGYLRGDSTVFPGFAATLSAFMLQYLPKILTLPVIASMQKPARKKV